MTEMKRFTVAFPHDTEEALSTLKKSDEFQKLSYSEIIRRLVKRGLDAGPDLASGLSKPHKMDSQNPLP